MKITSKGQVTIPVRIRRRLGLGPSTEVRWDIEGGTARLQKAPGGGRGEALVNRLTGRGSVRLTTDQIMKMTRG